MEVTMKLKEPMNKLNEGEFKSRMGESFPSIYLTIISIIQGVALGILANQIDKLFFHPAQGTTLARAWFLIVPYCIFSFSSILIVAYQYAWFIGLFKWSPTFWDIFFPFILGLSEIMPIFFLDNPAAWMLCTSIFSFTGILAWRNTLIHCTTYTFGEEYKALESTKKILIQNIKTALLVGLSLFILAILMFLLKYDYLEKSIFLWYFEVPAFLIFAVCAYSTFKKGEKFMKELHEDFGYDYDIPDKLRISITDLFFNKKS